MSSEFHHEHADPKAKTIMLHNIYMFESDSLATGMTILSTAKTPLVRDIAMAYLASKVSGPLSSKNPERGGRCVLLKRGKINNFDVSSNDLGALVVVDSKHLSRLYALPTTYK